MEKGLGVETGVSAVKWKLGWFLQIRHRKGRIFVIEGKVTTLSCLFCLCHAL